jgi:purine catabolism regulator
MALESRDSAYAPLTLAEALKNPALEGARVVAGRTGLGREVADIGVLDLGELDALRPGQLVLSSAYPLQETDLGQLFHRFSQEGVCAFGVKLGGFWVDMPAELVGAANATGVPLLKLPAGRFEDLVNPVLTAIAERQAERLRRSAVLHQSLTAAALRDETPAAIARVVMHALGRPVAIFNERDELLTATGPHTLWGSPELVEGGLATHDLTDVDVEGTTCLVAPIVAAGRRYGAMCVAGAQALDSFARGAVAQAAVVTAMQLVGEQGIRAIHRRFERELLDDLADGRVSPTEARKRASRVGWPLRRTYLVLVARRRGAAAPRLASTAPPVISDAEFRAFARAVATLPAETRVFRRRAGLAIVLHLGEREDERPSALKVAKRLADTQGVAWAAGELVVGASRVRRRISPDFATSFKEASLSADLSVGRPPPELIAWFDDLGSYRLVANVDDRDALARIASQILQPLRHLDADSERDLRETLLVLLAHNMRLSDAADDLHFHYNTVRHRLARLRDALGDRLDGPLRRVTLALALSALRVLAVDEGAATAPTRSR